MHSLDRAQVLLFCDLCQRDALQSHCELCQINLCKACVGEHLSDSSQTHKVVPYKQRTSTPDYPKCSHHYQKNCELYCDKCDFPVCSTCISSGQHKGHDFSDALQTLSFKTKNLEKDLKELEKRIYPAYKEIASHIQCEKENLEKHYEKLTTAVTKQAENWHKEIDIIVNKQKSEIEKMKTKHLVAHNEQKNEIEQRISKLRQSIRKVKKTLDSNDVSLTMAYKSRNNEFRKLPTKVNVSFPSFSVPQINTKQLHQMFGTLSALSITTEKHGFTMDLLEAVSCPLVKPLLNEPELIATIDTGYVPLCSVTCLTDEKIWTCGDNNSIRLYKLQGIDKQLKLVKTKSGEKPHNIAMTRSGDLVYTDSGKRTVNIVKSEQIHEVIRLQGWVPYYICSTSSGDLLVTMVSDDDKQSKVVRYSGSTEAQTIQFDSNNKPLYSPGFFKCISENRNHDICVTDNRAKEVVVVSQTGVLRFRYTGHLSTKMGPFDPFGITTDSQSQILISDYNNDCIHILDLDGQFLCYIGRYYHYNDSCGCYQGWGLHLNHPGDLCISTKDNLFVTENITGNVKKIRYMW